MKEHIVSMHKQHCDDTIVCFWAHLEEWYPADILYAVVLSLWLLQAWRQKTEKDGFASNLNYY